MNLNLRSLKAAAFFASDEQTRYYLCGVRVEIESRTVLAIATNGHGMVVARDIECGAGDDGEPCALTIPRDVLDSFKLTAKERNDGAPLPCSLERLPDGKWSLTYAGMTRVFEEVGGSFPDWRRVVPASVDNSVAQYDTRYLESFSRVAALLSEEKRSHLAIGHNGGGPALIRFDALESAFGVLMPFRTASAFTAPPAWLNAPQAASMLKEAA